MARLVYMLKKAISATAMEVNGLARSYSKSSSCSRSSRSPAWSSDVEYEEVDVPQGCFAVYAGSERRRFIVRMQHLNHPLFRALLERAAEEYGFDQAGGLSIPCEAVLFEHILWLLNNNDDNAWTLEIDELITFYSS